MTKYIYIFIFVFCQTFIQAQEQYLIVNADSISAAEFKEKYDANIKAEGLNKAIENYIDFKLISQYALNTKVDTTSYYKNNWQHYYDQESKKYLESEPLKKELASKIYENLKTEKKIEFFALNYDNPFDIKEKAAKKKELLSLRNKICEQQDTITLNEFRKEKNSGSFWLKPFTIPYQLENVIYNIPVGTCSPIGEQDFTAYFVKVYEERETKGLPPYKQIEEQLMNNLSQSSYLEILNQDLIKRIESKVIISEDLSALKAVLNVAKKGFNQNSTIIFKENKPIWEMPYSQYNQQDLVAFFKKIKNDNNLDGHTNFEALQSYFIPILKKDFILHSYKKNLPSLEPEFKNKLDLMSETLLVNYFIEKFVYAKASKDSLGQQAFLKQNQSKYIWPKRYKLSVFRYYNPKDEKALYKMIKQNKSTDDILKHFNDDKTQPAVVVSIGNFAEGHKDLPPNYRGNKKITKGKYLTQNAFFVLHQIIPSGPMTVKDAGKTFIEAYQSKYYNKVLKDLRKEAEITVPKALN